MSTSISWESIPTEICFTIFEKLPIKSQVSLGCTCKRMYQLSLDPFLANLEARTWIYLKDNIPLPDRLAKAITYLHIPSPSAYYLQHPLKEMERRSLLLQREILRMSNLQRLVVDYAGTKEKNKCMLFFSDLQAVVLQQNLSEIKVSQSFLTCKFSKGETLLHLAVEKGNVNLVDSLLSQLNFYFQLYGKPEPAAFYAAINARDEQGNTPLKIAVEKGNKDLILLLLKKGARDKEYLLSRENPDLSPFLEGTIDKGSHLRVDYLSPSSFSAFFEAVAANGLLVSLHFSEQGYKEFTSTGLDFFQKLAGALQSNFQRPAPITQENLEGAVKSLKLLVLDLRDCEGLTVQEVRPFFTCLELEELWLPSSLLDYLDERKQNLLHLLVQESPLNTKIAGSLIAQGVALSSRDDKGRTPLELVRELGSVVGNHEMVIFLKQAAKKKLAAIAFGKKDWEKYFGKVGKEPPLPIPILEVLESPCSIWPNKKVTDTHLLTLIPEKVNGQPLTLNYLYDLVNNPKGGGNKTTYSISYGGSFKSEFGPKASGSTYWVLMTKDVLPNTRHKPYENQLSELNTFAARAPKIIGLGEYQVPKVLEVATSLLMENVRSGNRFYAAANEMGEQWTYTRCEEIVKKSPWKSLWHVMLGGYSYQSFSIYDNAGDSEMIGLGALRRCLDP